MTLDTQQKQTLRAALETRRSALIAELRRDAARVRDEPFSALAGETQDRGDESVADLIADTDQSELSRDLEELREIELALQRFTTERYGSCGDCGIDIDPDRLRASPSVLRCAACQGRYERTHRGPKGAKL